MFSVKNKINYSFLLKKCLKICLPALEYSRLHFVMHLVLNFPLDVIVTDHFCSTECLKLIYTLFETLLLNNEMSQKYNFLCMIQKALEKHSNTFKYLNKHGGEIVIR